MMTDQTYACTKCGGTECETGSIRTTGSGLSRFLNHQNHKFGYVACAACGYTDLYKVDGSGKLGTVFDVLTN
jgi:predicted nucleic-acid-binding Zn-ribbon protein